MDKTLENQKTYTQGDGYSCVFGDGDGYENGYVCVFGNGDGYEDGYSCVFGYGNGDGNGDGYGCVSVSEYTAVSVFGNGYG